MDGSRMYSSRMSCPACKKSDDVKSFERYTIPVIRTMGFTKPDLEVVVCPNCGSLFTQKGKR